jgi:hypothetical protein
MHTVLQLQLCEGEYDSMRMVLITAFVVLDLFDQVRYHRPMNTTFLWSANILHRSPADHSMRALLADNSSVLIDIGVTAHKSSKVAPGTSDTTKSVAYSTRMMLNNGKDLSSRY